jgi:hypothetical protein
MSLRSWRNALVSTSLAGLVASMVILGCSSKETTTSGPGTTPDAGAPVSAQAPATTFFSTAITSVTIEIDYAPGAEPYVDMVKDFGDPWNLFHANALAIFGTRTVAFPRTLAKMEKLADVTAKTFTTADILAIASAHRSQPQLSDSVAGFYIVFLPGTFVDDTGTEQKTTLGISLADSGVIALFKPAISKPVVNPTPPPVFVEQLALVHFLGHAVGFVDNGVPVGDNNKAHIDTADGHHCTNKKCAMSVEIESAAGAAAYTPLVRSFESVLIGQECLSDARILEDKLRMTP